MADYLLLYRKKMFKVNSDSQLWKFSDKHNKDNTLFYVKKFIK